jgi:hypothetical protein
MGDRHAALDSNMLSDTCHCSGIVVKFIAKHIILDQTRDALDLAARIQWAPGILGEFLVIWPANIPSFALAKSGGNGVKKRSLG